MVDVFPVCSCIAREKFGNRKRINFAVGAMGDFIIESSVFDTLYFAVDSLCSGIGHVSLFAESFSEKENSDKINLKEK